MPQSVITSEVHQSHTSEKNRLLLAICSTPPLTSGIRTFNRLSMAREILGFGRLEVANIFALATRSSSEISDLGKEFSTWLQSRAPIEAGVLRADGVILAYGTTPPVGPARMHWRKQVEWLQRLVAETEVPVWTVSDEPRHPSRWQRYTFRAYPDLTFEAALVKVLNETPRHQADSI